MDGFTPGFFLNLVIALLSGGIAYGVLKTDLKNTIAGWLPAIAALVTILWTGIRILETQTVQKLLKKFRRKKE